LGIVVILSGLILVFAQEMRTEAIASANRLSYLQADAIEQGAEKWVLAQVESYPGDAVTITQIPAEALQVGDGYFWVITPDPTTDQAYQFGITDEAGKVNLNTASANSGETPSLTKVSLYNMPGFDARPDIVDSIYNWHLGPTAGPIATGADTDYYSELQPEGYDAKNSAFETVEELLLVKDVTKDLLYGLDLNHDGVVDNLERASGGGANVGISFNNADGTNRGVFNDVTVYSSEPVSPRIAITNTTALRSYLQKQLGAARANQVMARVSPPGRPMRFSSLAQFYQRAAFTPTELSQVCDRLTASTGKTLTGLININTAPREVLMCLPGLDPQSDPDTLIAQRESVATTGSIGWVLNALSPPSKGLALLDSITGRSFVYSADIVAVSGDGRAFKRVRIVVDATKYPTQPAKIVYRKDLTSLGWPLPPDIRKAMRAGQPPQVGLAGTVINFGQ
jgi:type II secretory pathway component PulK